MRQGSQPLHWYSITLKNRGKFDVVIWKTLAGLRSARKQCGDGRSDNVLAFCHWDYQNRPEVIATLHFAKPHLNLGSIAHEASHATWRWCERKNVKTRLISPRRWSRRSQDPEERFAYTLDALVRGVVKGLRRVGLW